MGCCCIFTYLAKAVLIFQLLFKVFPWLYQNVAPKFLGPKVKVDSYGKWAVITGATEGIGKAYAKALAKKNLNLVLVSRNPEKLENVSKEITDKYQVEIKTIAVDFKSGLGIYETISKGIQGLEVGVLVNNIGISYSHPEFFLEAVKQDPGFLQDIISCNINSVTYMTKLVLPAMVERKKGLIINISSMAAVIPNPLLSVYSSTKAFVDKFTEDLNTEYKDQGILIQSVLPGFVCSNMSKIKRPSLLTPSADTYVNSALNTLGYSRHTTGYLPHALMALILGIMASVNLDFANNFVLKELLNTRKKALKREKKN